MKKVRIAVAGAGLIGLRHIEETVPSSNCVLAGIVDPGPKAPDVQRKFGVPLYPSLAECFSKSKPDGIVLATPNHATPNHMHVAQTLECIAAGVPLAHTFGSSMRSRGLRTPEGSSRFRWTEERQ